MADNLNGDALVHSLKQLIFSFERHIRAAGSRSQVENTLLHLEENDAVFHRCLVTFLLKTNFVTYCILSVNCNYLLLFRYDFVKGLNQKIEASLGRILDEELERESLHPNDSVLGQESAVTRIISKVRQTPEYDCYGGTIFVR